MIPEARDTAAAPRRPVLCPDCHEVRKVGRLCRCERRQSRADGDVVAWAQAHGVALESEGAKRLHGDAPLELPAEDLVDAEHEHERIDRRNAARRHYLDLCRARLEAFSRIERTIKSDRPTLEERVLVLRMWLEEDATQE